MHDNPSHIATLLKCAEDFSKTNVELFRLKAIDKSANLLSSLLSSLLILVALIISFLILNIGVSLWIGALLGQSFYGFFIVGGFYALLSVLLVIFREKWLKYSIKNRLIKQMRSKN